MPREDHALRLFVAAYPPASFIERAHAQLRELTLPPHRLTPPSQVHLTLQFIGDVSQRELDSVIETVTAATHGVRAFTLSPRTLITLPERGPKRLVAVECDAPRELIELHRRLAQRLARSARLNPADRFLPHLTITRFRMPTNLSALRIDANLHPFPVDHVRLMRSVLRPEGAHHDTIAQCQLVT